MPLKSHLILDASVFDDSNLPKEIQMFNAGVKEATTGQPTWVEVGAPKYRQMRKDGDTVFPSPPVLADGLNITIPSREAGRTIPCRLFYPSNNAQTEANTKPKTKGVFAHIHGGGWVLFDECSTDSLLKFYADTTGCAAVSIGYRLAPEHPWPAPVEDCEDAVEWLARNAEEEFGGPLAFIGGESAGGHLSLVSCYHLLRTLPTFTLLGGLVLHFPATDLTHLPSAFSIPNAPILTRKDIQNFLGAFVPNLSAAEIKNPRISPLYQDLSEFKGRLPRALITCGTQDPLLDDSVFMAAKWQMAGAEAVLRIYTGAVHGFVAFPREMLSLAGECLGDVAVFMADGMKAVEGRSPKL